MVSVIIIGLYAVGRYVLGITSAGNSLFVPPIAVILALLTALFSLWAYFFAGEKHAHRIGLIAYLATTLTITALIEFTGQAWSPFIALWLLVGVFSGMFGRWILGIFVAAANVHIIFSLLTHNYGADKIIEMILIADAPLIASYVIWHTKTHQESAKDAQALDALANQLSQVANKSEIVINAISDGVVAVDARGVVQLINPAAQAILGWPQQDALGLDYKSVVKLGDHNGTPLTDGASPIQQVLLSKKPLTSNDVMLITKSGKKMMISLAVSPEGSGTGGAIAVFRDITREKEEERQQAEFISTASHEMRTPVAAIEGYLALALNPQTANIDDKARLYLQKAHESTQHLGRLFQDLLTVSKAEDSRVIPHPIVVDITAFAREITESLQQKAQQKGIQLIFKPGQDGQGNRQILPVYYSFVDPDHLREVLNNLVDNGIKYTKQGSVTVDVTGGNDTVTVSITDTGIGIPPEDVPHLFQKFYRVDNSDTREIGGTGLGLYICRRLMEANNGRVGVKSVYGKGSTFYAEVPRMSHDTTTTTTPPLT